jgi:outer membrane protein OmpA-like peptidoglycan-associated protein
MKHGYLLLKFHKSLRGGGGRRSNLEKVFRKQDCFVSLAMTIGMGLVIVLAGCATVPIAAPQALLNARAALGMAKQFKADILAPDDYQQAKRVLEQTETAFAHELSMVTVEDLAFEAKADAEIAEARARCRLAEREQEMTQQALISQQAALVSLTQKEAALQAAVQQLRQTEADKMTAQTRAAEEAKKAEEEARKRAEAEREADMLRRAQQIKNAQVRMEARGLVINLSGKVLFDSGSSQLQSGAYAQLNQIAGVVKEYSEYRVKIEGHTDNTGADLENNLLSQARAESVLSCLNHQGVPLDNLTAMGLGSGRPLATNKTPEGRQLNRRVEIILEKRSESAN